MPNATEEQCIEENAAYVLGMYDLYQNDQEIIDALKAKGLDDRITQLVLQRVKKPSYEKRIQQAKRNMLIGALVFVLLFLVPFILFTVNGFSLEEELSGGKRAGESMLRSAYKLYRSIYIFIIFASVAQALIGCIAYFKYKKLYDGQSG